MTTEREAFEANKIMSGANTGKSVGQLGIKYANPTVQLMWIGWQGSRKVALEEARVICEEVNDYVGGSQGAIDCVNAIKDLK